MDLCFQVMAHADWLLRGPEKSVLPSRALCDGNTLFDYMAELVLISGLYAK